MPTPRSILRAGVLALAAVTLAGCVTGQRPSFDDNQPSRGATGNEAIDEVLTRLDAAGSTPQTVIYRITGANGDAERAAVVIAKDGRRSITVGDDRYLIENGGGITCDLTTDECEASLNDARISNLQITHEFYGPAFAQRLRVDANRRVQDPIASTEEIGGEEATCVTVAVSGGEKTYCAVESGVLARYDGPDTRIELQRARPRADESRFSTGR